MLLPSLNLVSWCGANFPGDCQKVLADWPRAPLRQSVHRSGVVRPHLQQASGWLCIAPICFLLQALSVFRIAQQLVGAAFVVVTILSEALSLLCGCHIVVVAKLRPLWLWHNSPQLHRWFRWWLYHHGHSTHPHWRGPLVELAKQRPMVLIFDRTGQKKTWLNQDLKSSTGLTRVRNDFDFDIHVFQTRPCHYCLC